MTDNLKYKKNLTLCLTLIFILIVIETVTSLISFSLGGMELKRLTWKCIWNFSEVIIGILIYYFILKPIKE